MENEDNPLRAPWMLLEMAEGPLPDSIDAIVNRIKAFPEDFMQALREKQSVVPESFDRLPEFSSGLRKTHDGVPPTDEELATIRYIHDNLQSIARAFREYLDYNTPAENLAAEYSSIADEVERIHASLPKERLAYGFVQDWTRSLRDELYPDPERRLPGPDLNL